MQSEEGMLIDHLQLSSSTDFNYLNNSENNIDGVNDDEDFGKKKIFIINIFYFFFCSLSLCFMCNLFWLTCQKKIEETIEALKRLKFSLEEIGFQKKILS